MVKSLIDKPSGIPHPLLARSVRSISRDTVFPFVLSRSAQVLTSAQGKRAARLGRSPPQTWFNCSRRVSLKSQKRRDRCREICGSPSAWGCSSCCWASLYNRSFLLSLPYFHVTRGWFIPPVSICICCCSALCLNHPAPGD